VVFAARAPATRPITELTRLSVRIPIAVATYLTCDRRHEPMF